MWLMQNGMKNPDNAGAASTDYMHLFGLDRARLYVGAHRQGGAGASGGGTSHAALDAKLWLARFFNRARAARGGARISPASPAAPRR